MRHDLQVVTKTLSWWRGSERGNGGTWLARSSLSAARALIDCRISLRFCSAAASLSCTAQEERTVGILGRCQVARLERGGQKWEGEV